MTSCFSHSTEYRTQYYQENKEHIKEHVRKSYRKYIHNMVNTFHTKVREANYKKIHRVHLFYKEKMETEKNKKYYLIALRTYFNPILDKNMTKEEIEKHYEKLVEKYDTLSPPEAASTTMESVSPLMNTPSRTVVLRRKRQRKTSTQNSSTVEPVENIQMTVNEYFQRFVRVEEVQPETCQEHESDDEEFVDAQQDIAVENPIVEEEEQEIQNPNPNPINQVIEETPMPLLRSPIPVQNNIQKEFIQVFKRAIMLGMNYVFPEENEEQEDGYVKKELIDILKKVIEIVEHITL